MTTGARSGERGSARLLPERRQILRRLVAAVGRDRAARALGVGALILERAVDPYELLHEATIRRLDAALDRLDAPPALEHASEPAP